jgi:hypothetical protein
MGQSAQTRNAKLLLSGRGAIPPAPEKRFTCNVADASPQHNDLHFSVVSAILTVTGTPPKRGAPSLGMLVAFFAADLCPGESRIPAG